MKKYTFLIERCQRIGNELLYFDLANTYVPSQVMVRFNFDKTIREARLHKKGNMLYLTMELEEYELDYYPCVKFDFNHCNVVDYKVTGAKVTTISLCGNAPKGVRTIRRQLEQRIWWNIFFMFLYACCYGVSMNFFAKGVTAFNSFCVTMSLIWLVTSIIKYENSKL